MSSLTGPTSDGWNAGRTYEEFMGRWSRPLAGEFLEWLEPNALFRRAGLRDVAVAPISVPTDFGGFEDYWSPFLGGTGPAPSFVATLSDDQRRALAADLRDRLPVQDGGRIHLRARAWAVVGTAGR